MNENQQVLEAWISVAIPLLAVPYLSVKLLNFGIHARFFDQEVSHGVDLSNSRRCF